MMEVVKAIAGREMVFLRSPEKAPVVSFVKWRLRSYAKLGKSLNPDSPSNNRK